MHKETEDCTRDFHQVACLWRRTLTNGSDVKYISPRCPLSRRLSPRFLFKRKRERPFLSVPARAQPITAEPCTTRVATPPVRTAVLTSRTSVPWTWSHWSEPRASTTAKRYGHRLSVHARFVGRRVSVRASHPCGLLCLQGLQNLEDESDEVKFVSRSTKDWLRTAQAKSSILIIFFFREILEEREMVHECLIASGSFSPGNFNLKVLFDFASLRSMNPQAPG